MHPDADPHRSLPSDADRATVVQWIALRDAVVEELRGVGLPVKPGWRGSVVDGDVRTGGVFVDVSTAADGGGVTIHWCQPEAKLVPLVAAQEADNLDGSMVFRYGQVSAVLTNAAVLVLGVAGYTLAPSEDDYSAGVYDVLAGPQPG